MRGYERMRIDELTKELRETKAKLEAVEAVIERAKEWSAVPGCGTPLLDAILDRTLR